MFSTFTLSVISPHRLHLSLALNSYIYTINIITRYKLGTRIENCTVWMMDGLGNTGAIPNNAAKEIMRKRRRRQMPYETM